MELRTLPYEQVGAYIFKHTEKQLKRSKKWQSNAEWIADDWGSEERCRERRRKGDPRMGNPDGLCIVAVAVVWTEKSS